MLASLNTGNSTQLETHTGTEDLAPCETENTQHREESSVQVSAVPTSGGKGEWQGWEGLTHLWRAGEGLPLNLGVETCIYLVMVNFCSMHFNGSVPFF